MMKSRVWPCDYVADVGERQRWSKMRKSRNRDQLLGGSSTWIMMSPVIKPGTETDGRSGMEMQ